MDRFSPSILELINEYTEGTSIDARRITSICNYTACLRMIPRQDREKIVFQGDDIIISFDLSNFILGFFDFPYHNEGGWTFEHLVTTICEKYLSMYQEEVEAVGPMRIQRYLRDGAFGRGRRRRIESNGPYGFTGYSPHHLAMDRIHISRNGNVSFRTTPG